MVWSDKIDEFAIKEGESLAISVDFESREFNGRWYTDVKAWKVTRAGAAADDNPFSEPGEYNTTQPDSPPPLEDDVILF